jgi:hypothetical membrane protein
MPLHWISDRSLNPRVSGLAGLTAVLVVMGGSLLAMAAHPSYSVLHHYVSQLAARSNPAHWFFDLGLGVGGVLLAIFSWGLGGLVSGRYGRRAAWLGVVAGGAMVLVGIFPLTVPVAHFGSAFVLFASAIFATLFVGLGLRDMARSAERPGPLRAGGRWLVGIFGFMILMSVAGFVHTGFAYRHVTSTDPTAVLKELPMHQLVTLGSVTFNPVALQEWVFLILAMGLVLVGSIQCLRRPSKRP